MEKMIREISILMAEDDVEDQMLVRDAMEESRLANKLTIVSNGEELLEHLRSCTGGTTPELPGLVLLDLDMPRKDGREALAEMRQDPALRRIPVVVLTTSSSEEDILRTYDLGASTYIRKPVTFDKLVDVIRTIGTYWFEIAELPNPNGVVCPAPEPAQT